MANYQWDRPIYFSAGGIYNQANILYLNNYPIYGVSLQISTYTPQNVKEEWGYVNSEAMYKIIKKFHWGHLKDPRAYTDYNGRRNILTYLNAVNRTSRAIIAEDKKQKAQEIMNLLERESPQKLYEEHSSLI